MSSEVVLALKKIFAELIARGPLSAQKAAATKKCAEIKPQNDYDKTLVELFVKTVGSPKLSYYEHMPKNTPAVAFRAAMQDVYDKIPYRGNDIDLLIEMATRVNDDIFHITETGVCVDVQEFYYKKDEN